MGFPLECLPLTLISVQAVKRPPESVKAVYCFCYRNLCRFLPFLQAYVVSDVSTLVHGKFCLGARRVASAGRCLQRFSCGDVAVVSTTQCAMFEMKQTFQLSSIGMPNLRTQVMNDRHGYVCCDKTGRPSAVCQTNVFIAPAVQFFT